MRYHIVTMPRFITIILTNRGLRFFRQPLGFCAATLLTCSALAFHASGAIMLNFANIPGTSITFSGGAFSFSSANGYQFDITSVSGGVGDAVGLNGYISTGPLMVSGGPFTIGPITTMGQEQTASVMGTGTLHITDSHSVDLTGAIQWENIATFGVAGILDLTGTINLTGITYSGANHDLGQLAAAGGAADVVTFQFLPAETLTQLATTGGSSSYSGVLAPVPEPGTLPILGIGLAGLVGALRRWRKK
jgi:hypothetical protein